MFADDEPLHTYVQSCISSLSDVSLHITLK